MNPKTNKKCTARLSPDNQFFLLSVCEAAVNDGRGSGKLKQWRGGSHVIGNQAGLAVRGRCSTGVIAEPRRPTKMGMMIPWIGKLQILCHSTSRLV